MFDLSNVALMGEVMLELAPRPDGGFSLGVAGDTYNTSIVLSRLGVNTEFITALGGEHYSRFILSDFSRHGIGRTDVISVPDKLPGLYIIDNDENGARHFSYWRSQSAAKYAFTNPRLFSCCLEAISGKSALYWSGVTLALLSDETRSMMFRFLAEFRQAGGVVFFDSNFRKRLWDTSSNILDGYVKAIQSCDVYMTSFDDEYQITGCVNKHLMLEQLRTFDQCDIVLTMAGEAVWLSGGEQTPIRLNVSPNAVDVTGAGDAFNGGLIAALARGKTMQEAIEFAQSIANRVVSVRGATLAESAWADIMKSFLESSSAHRMGLVANNPLQS